jgi:hypothetical protein
LTVVPLFHLSDIGGVDGLARWVRLAEKHERLAVSVASVYRYGGAGPESALLDVAASIEYWVKVNRQAAWSKSGVTIDLNGRKRMLHSLALAKKVGSAFFSWIGDAEAWSKDFDFHYNSLKHSPNYAADPYVLTELARVGRLLLLAALLDRVAGSKQPSRAIFRSHRIARFGHTLIRGYKARAASVGGGAAQ